MKNNFVVGQIVKVKSDRARYSRYEKKLILPVAGIIKHIGVGDWTHPYFSQSKKHTKSNVDLATIHWFSYALPEYDAVSASEDFYQYAFPSVTVTNLMDFESYLDSFKRRHKDLYKTPQV